MDSGRRSHVPDAAARRAVSGEDERPRHAAGRPAPASARLRPASPLPADGRRDPARLRLRNGQRRRWSGLGPREPRVGLDGDGGAATRPADRRLGAHVRRRRPASLHARVDALALAPARLPALRAAHARRRPRRPRPQERVLPRRPLRARTAAGGGLSGGRFFGNCAASKPRTLAVEQGTSPGYTDLYPAHFHGQNLELRSVPAGDYVLVHRANPAGLLEELDYRNNAASLRIRLTWKGRTPLVETLRTCESSADC